MLTAALVAQLGSAAVTAVDPSAPFVAATHARLPDVDVRIANAEDLPFGDDTFDLALAQLVVQFMDDPVGGLQELARVTRPGGIVAASIWDHAGGRGPLSPFWRAVNELYANAEDESRRAGTRAGHLAELFVAAGIEDVEQSELTVRLGFRDFDDWWEPFTFGVGPAGAYVAGLDETSRDRLRDRCAERLPTGGFELDAVAWVATGRG
jgi:SAM-dependent methyltransferase